MDPQTQSLFTEALKLPADSREDLAIRLMGTVEPAEAEAVEVRRAWMEEIERRVAAADESNTTAVQDAWPKITGKPWRARPANE